MPMIQERSIDTDAVITALREVNGEVSYKELSKRSGVSVGRAKTVLASARRILRKENILFGVIRGEGLKRLGDLEKARATGAVKKKIARAAGRGIKDLATIENFEALPNVEQLMVTTDRTVFHLIREEALTKTRGHNGTSSDSASSAERNFATPQVLLGLAKAAG